MFFVPAGVDGLARTTIILHARVPWPAIRIPPGCDALIQPRFCKGLSEACSGWLTGIHPGWRCRWSIIKQSSILVQNPHCISFPACVLPSFARHAFARHESRLRFAHLFCDIFRGPFRNEPKSKTCCCSSFRWCRASRMVCRSNITPDPFIEIHRQTTG